VITAPAEYALLLAAEPQPPAADITAGDIPAAHGPALNGAAGLARLSPRERELLTLVARGRTDAQIAAERTSPYGRSALTWTGSGTRPAAAAARISPGWPSAQAWSDSADQPRASVGGCTPAADGPGGRAWF
jgi:hypothetical protein